ncbi:hypothetical protein AMK09_06285 [Streptomyces sp. CB02488]|uniref:hypothetical protein n=1 Tax=Streptomyces sp. CB02488 TaxID=1703920 RepID=UPI00093D79D0|nr:hypothetical protein [Streptomyces sp. CB02488]OKK24417.1 hypothetical protein AMK09_06285 [Streptomyces sp. CB02488]
MNGRSRVRGNRGDLVGQLCTGVWLAGHVAAAFTLGTLIVDHQPQAAAEGLATTRSDLDAQPQAHDA